MSCPPDLQTSNPADLFKPTIIDLDLDDAVDHVLSPPTTNNEEDQELSIPRERVASAVGSTRVIAKLERPIRMGSFNDQTAYLLSFHFSFQRVQDDIFNRIRGAVVEITFEDASPPPPDGTAGRRKNPSVVKFHPVLYTGPISQGTLTSTTEANLQIPSTPNGPTTGLSHSRQLTVPQESRLLIHGALDGTSTWNIVRWTVEEDEILKQGMPHEMRLRVIINMKKPRRFLARVTLSAHYMFMKGALAKLFPVIGKAHDPLYFDHDILKEIATKQNQVGPDGTRIVEMVGRLDDALDTVQPGSFLL